MIDVIRLSHGSGSGLNELLQEIILPCLTDGQGAPLEDAAIFRVNGTRLAFTTDSFVVQPLEFNGGNIGKLAACGTINDLAMMGATPHSMSVSLILEEGLSAETLRRMLMALAETCRNAGVAICCGDTKVVDRGKADGMFITTSGIGVVPEERTISVANLSSSDAVLVSGPIGRHGIAIMAARKGLNFASSAISDCACLHTLVESLLTAVPATRSMRDATRGGCAAVLNEMALASNTTIALQQDAIPIDANIKSACAFLGIDPLHSANEGTFVAIVPAGDASTALSVLQRHELGRGAAIIGTVRERGRFPVVMETAIGGTRVVDVPPGELLPRIC